MKNKLRKTLISSLACCALALLSSTASAQVEAHFQLFDENGDGVLSGNELALLNPLDVQYSGRVNLNAFTIAVQSRKIAHQAQWLTLLGDRDGNKDGRLSGNEFSGFEFADTDSNGRVEEKEFLEGARAFYRSMATLSPKAISDKATERFQMMDLNEDGRLSGNEAVFMVASDLSGDKRITKQEYTTAAILDVIASEEGSADAVPAPPVAPPGAPRMATQSDAFRSIVQAINNQDSEGLIALCRPEFQKMLNVEVLKYLFAQIKKGNGNVSAPADVRVTDGSEAGTKLLAAKLQSERGVIAVSALMLDDKMLGMAIKGESADKFVAQLFSDMIADVDGLMTTFAKDSSPDCMRMIRRIQAGEDDVAISMFHPEIPQQVKRETFDSLFTQFREMVGKYQKIELEAAGAELNAEKTSGFLNVTHRVEGTAGVALVQHKLQIVGLKPYIVSISVEPAKD